MEQTVINADISIGGTYRNIKKTALLSGTLLCTALLAIIASNLQQPLLFLPCLGIAYAAHVAYTRIRAACEYRVESGTLTVYRISAFRLTKRISRDNKAQLIATVPLNGARLREVADVAAALRGGGCVVAVVCRSRKPRRSDNDAADGVWLIENGKARVVFSPNARIRAALYENIARVRPK